MATHDPTTHPAVHRAFDNTHNISAWRKRADRLRALARATGDERQRLELLELAGQWDGMAARAELYARRVSRRDAEAMAPRDR